MFRIEDKTIYITRGDSASMEVSVTQADSTDYTLQNGDKLTFSVKRSVRDEEALISKTITSGSCFDFTPEDTAGLVFGEYRYDLQLKTKDGKVFTIIEPSGFVVCSEVTE